MTMAMTISAGVRQSLAIIAALVAGCGDEAPLAPDRQTANAAQLATVRATDTDRAIATLRRVTARYHDLNAAIAEEFGLLHECENRPGEGPVGTVYVNMERLLDGRIDPELPDALIYEPGRNGHLKLVGVEFAIPNAGQEPPEFLGATFQREDEFGVFALHVWVWSDNPNGLFAETNPRVSCGTA
jgi:hypothetical protein